jgi:hypothetical protein
MFIKCGNVHAFFVDVPNNVFKSVSRKVLVVFYVITIFYMVR